MGVLNVCVEAGVKSKKIIITTIISLVSALSIQAQTAQAAPDKAPDAKEEKLQDYSKGFQVFYKLGLPDVSKAEYIQLDSNDISVLNLLMANIFNTSGNAWLLKKEEGGNPASFIAFNAVPLKAYDRNKLFDEFKKRRGKDSESNPSKEYADFLAENKAKTLALWENVDIKESTEELLSQLEEMDKESFSYQKEMSGPLFLYAIQIYSKGFKNEANKIIARLFELAGDKKIVLLAAMSSLANQQYGQALIDLKASRNWKKFGEDLDSLLKKYPKGWKAAPGIKLLREMVEKQIALKVLPEIKGDGLSEEDKKLAAELANIDAVPYLNEGGWLFPKDEKEKRNDLYEKCISNIIGKGKDAVPMLIALLNDDYMIPICEMQNSRSLSRMENDDNKAEEALSSIPHPVKRKDIAKALLLSVVLNHEKSEDSNIMSLNDEDFAEACRQWYGEIKDKAPAELELYYLRNGNRNQQYLAVMSMMKADQDKNAPVIEEFFLNMNKEELMRSLGYGAVPEYVAKRKKAALPFVEKLRAKFKDELEPLSKGDVKKDKKDLAKQKGAEEETAEEEEEDSSMDRQMQEELKKILDSLHDLAKEKGAKQIIDEILSGKKNFRDRTIYSQLMPALKEMDRDEAIGLLLNAISQTDNILVKGLFFSGLEMVARDEESPSAKNGKKEEKQPDIKKNAEAWKKILKDETGLGRYKINLVAAIFIESIYGNKEDKNKLQKLQNTLRERLGRITLKRAEERLAGSTLTPYPEIRELDETASKKLVMELEQAIADKKIGSFVDGMEYSELAALPKLVEKNPRLNTGLADYANRIVSIESRLKGREKDLDAFKNGILDMKTVEKIQDYCRKLTTEKQAFNCMITRSPSFDGVEIEISDPTEFIEISETRLKGDIDIPLLMNGSIGVGTNHAYAQWEVTDKTGKEKDKEEIVVNGKKMTLEKLDEKESQRNGKMQEKFSRCLEKAFGKDGKSTDPVMMSYNYMRY